MAYITVDFGEGGEVNVEIEPKDIITSNYYEDYDFAVYFYSQLEDKEKSDFLREMGLKEVE